MPREERLKPYSSLANPKEREEQPFSGRIILVTGATNGIGNYMAHLAHELGAEVVIGTRSESGYQRMVEELGGKRVHPFVADITKSNEVQGAFDWLVHLNKVPTDVVLCAAGGLEELLDPKKGFALDTGRLRRFKGEERNSKIGELQKTFILEVQNTMEYAEAINYFAQIDLVQKLRQIPSHGPRILIFESSLWSSIYGDPTVEIPEFYKGIARTKHMFEEWLTENAQGLVAKGIYPAILSGNIVLDSNIGQFVNSLLRPLLTEEEQKVLDESYLYREDMVRETARILTSDPGTWPEYPLRRFLIKPGEESVGSLSPKTSIFGVNFLL